MLVGFHYIVCIAMLFESVTSDQSLKDLFTYPIPHGGLVVSRC